MPALPRFSLWKIHLVQLHMYMHKGQKSESSSALTRGQGCCYDMVCCHCQPDVWKKNWLCFPSFSETRVEIKESVRGQDIFIIQTIPRWGTCGSVLHLGCALNTWISRWFSSLLPVNQHNNQRNSCSVVIALICKASRSVKLLTFPGDWLQHWDASHQIAGVCHLRQEQEWLMVSTETSLLCVLVAFQAQLLGDFWLAFPSQGGWFPLPLNHQATEPAWNSSCCIHCRLDYSSPFAVVMWSWARVEAHNLPPVLLQFLMMVGLFGFYFGLF